MYMKTSVTEILSLINTILFYHAIEYKYSFQQHHKDNAIVLCLFEMCTDILPILTNKYVRYFFLHHEKIMNPVFCKIK